MIISPQPIDLKLIRHVGAHQKAAMWLSSYSSEAVGTGAPNSLVA
jgi:hypothetical protein